MGQVDGKVVVVTGGASGVGAACANTLAREGAKVVVTDLDDTDGRAVMDKIGSTGGEAIFLHQDVSVMVANAGIGILCRAVEMSLADWRRQTAVNLDGASAITRWSGAPTEGV